jgi:hypothetical protein
LRGGGVGAIEDDIRASDAGGLRTAIREQAPARQGELGAGVAFSGFETAGERQIGEEHNGRVQRARSKATDRASQWV